MTLTDTLIRSLKANGKIQKKSDGGGLYIHVSPTGGKFWRLAYRRPSDGKQDTLCFGSYDVVSLREAREKRGEAKTLLAKGIDPKEYQKAVKASRRADAGNTFENIAREWFGRQTNWTEGHRKHILSSLTRDFFPLIGTKPIGSMKAHELLEPLRRIEGRGAVESAHRALQTCGQIFRYAIATGRAEHNIAADLKGALPPAKKTHFASITDPAKIGTLLNMISQYSGNIYVKFVLMLSPLVMVRPSELREAEWEEFDLEGGEWHIPAERMKKREAHVVPLSRQAKDILLDLHQYTGDGKYLFPSIRGRGDTLSAGTVLAALRYMGYGKDEMTIHGFRAMASTLLNEKGYNADWVEKQLSHKDKDAVRSSYNHARYLDARRQMMQDWADYLDELKRA